MSNEIINLNTVFSGFNSGTDLQPKNTRTNNQGVTINNIAGFVKIGAKPYIGAGTKGDIVFSDATNQLYVCTTSYGPGVAVWVESPVFVTLT